MLHATIQAITSLQDVRPSATVNKLFTQLVNEVVAAPPDLHIETNTRRRMQRITSAAETELELYWARRVIASLEPEQELANFPYCDNYRELVHREIDLLGKSGLILSSSTRILMIGTGPLPMTALELMRQRGAQIDHVDVSLTALALCSLVSNRLGLACGHILGNGTNITLTNRYNTVIIAGLAGVTVSQKQAIINNILPAIADGGRILIRSAYGPRTLLYPGFPANAFSHLELLQEYHPNDNIINSVFIYRKEKA